MDETDWLSARGPQLPELPTVGTDLRAVIPVASPTLGDGVRIVSIEIYDQGLVVRSLIAPPPDDRHSLAQGQSFELSDDVGTRYRHFGFGSFGHKEAVRAEALYVPAPPDTATALVVVPKHVGSSGPPWRLSAVEAAQSKEATDEASP